MNYHPSYCDLFGITGCDSQHGGWVLNNLLSVNKQPPLCRHLTKFKVNHNRCLFWLAAEKHLSWYYQIDNSLAFRYPVDSIQWTRLTFSTGGLHPETDNWGCSFSIECYWKIAIVSLIGRFSLLKWEFLVFSSNCSFFWSNVDQSLIFFWKIYLEAFYLDVLSLAYKICVWRQV